MILTSREGKKKVPCPSCHPMLSSKQPPEKEGSAMTQANQNPRHKATVEGCRNTPFHRQAYVRLTSLFNYASQGAPFASSRLSRLSGPEMQVPEEHQEGGQRSQGSFSQVCAGLPFPP